jgi:hypothetical protein
MNTTKHIVAFLMIAATLFSGCYSFRDVSIPPEVKTIRIQYIENRAPYINPQLAPQYNDRLKQKITNQTKLTVVQSDNADYDVSGTITNYSVSTSAISNQQASANRLTVSIKITLRDQNNKIKNFDVSRNFDFSANLTLQQAEGQLGADIIRSMVDETFNRIFSNW